MVEERNERVYVDARRHGVVLVRPLGRAFVLAAPRRGRVPRRLAGLGRGRRAPRHRRSGRDGGVWRWDHTRVVLTGEKLFVVHGTLHRKAAAVRLEKVQTVELEQSVLGRLLGYGTLVAGDLEISCVASPSQVHGLLNRALTGS